MNIFKKATACLAAAAVMTSVAVTASAEYIVARADSRDGSGRGLAIMSLPAELKSYVVNVVYVNFFTNSDEECEYSLMLLINRTNSEVYGAVEKLKNGRLDPVDDNLHCEAGVAGEYGDSVFVDFSDSSGWFEKFSQYNRVRINVAGITMTDDHDYFDYFSSTGDPVDKEYAEWVSFDWGLSGDNSENSEPASSGTPGYVEPTESEPASSQTSGYAEPEASSPTSSEPVSEPVSSETSASTSSNVDTGATGIAAVVGTAVLAAGAVIVTRKRK